MSTESLSEKNETEHPKFCPECFTRQVEEGFLPGMFVCCTCGHEFDADGIDWANFVPF